MDFVIIGTARTGSQLLVSLLNSHPDICCEMKILRTGMWHRPMRPVLWLWRYKPYPYLWYRSWRMRQKTKTAHYGFKLFPSQVISPNSEAHALYASGWRILYLYRGSLFQQTLSGVVAI